MSLINVIHADHSYIRNDFHQEQNSTVREAFERTVCRGTHWGIVCRSV